MYRPTVRYDDCFKNYVDEVFKCTGLDRNKIFRLALYLLPYTKEGKDVLTFFSNSPLPQPIWNKNSMVEWYGESLELVFDDREGGRDVNVNAKEKSLSRSNDKTSRQERTIHQETKITDQKGEIIFRLGNSILLPR